ncbi:MAG: metalloregulator ArsR/SmtB family transcription factor [Desulfobulbaceae bacterium]|nr:metalloregulator ArsR/SmtB family transcription factor [Desulfobulbaceae bacterium]
MKALSDPSRVKVIKALEVRELCVCELRAVLGLAQPTVSKHLKVLEEAGLVASRKEGQWVHYRLSPTSMYAEAMLAQLKGWLTSDADVRGVLTQLPSIDRHELCGGKKGKGVLASRSRR